MATMSIIYRILFCLSALVVYATALECYELNDCNECTGPQGEANACVWCLDKSNNTVSTTDGKDGKPPPNAAGQCSTECPVDTTIAADESFTLGIATTTITPTKNPAYTDPPPKSFVGLNVTRVDIKLRRGTTAKFTVALKKGPIRFSLYFLLDLSASMFTSKEAVKAAAPSLPSAFANDNEEIAPVPFEFGFGSFVDKAIPPFTFDRFAAGYDVPTYGYKHEVQLTQEGQSFGDRVGAIQLSGNNDAPEGGLDAVTQAIYCDQFAKWPSADVPSLRLVLFVTDELSHVAGDGIEAGIRWPAELKCHSQLFFGNHKSFYPHQMMNPLRAAETQCNGQACVYNNFIHDYPSIEQIKLALEEKETSLAFVVPSSDSAAEPGVRQQYEEFVKVLGDKGIVSEDTLNDIRESKATFDNTARQNYYTLFKKTPVFVGINGDEFDNFFGVTSTCEAVEGGRAVCIEKNATCADEDKIEIFFNCFFSVSRKIVGGSGDLPRRPVETTMTSSLFGQFRLAVETSTCDCPEANFFLGLAGAKCNGNGVLNDDNCGFCQCDPVAQATGEYCDCSVTGKFTRCPTGENGLECSDRGECECGRCVCKENFSGQKCECSSKCGATGTEKVCGGAEAGTCDCGKCTCNEPYSGEKCECNSDNCKAPGSTKICNGNGKCECNACKCDIGYSGPFCETCDPVEGAKADPPVLCGDDPFCAVCSRQGRTDDPDPSTWGCECCFQRRDANYTGEKSQCQWCTKSSQCISRATINEANESQSTAICFREFVDEDGNPVDPDTSVASNTTTKTKTRATYWTLDSIFECPPPEPFNSTPVIIGTVLGLLALILLAILLWRLLAFLKDKKEWENYEKDKAKSKWQADNNPIFKSSVAEFENPIFD